MTESKLQQQIVQMMSLYAGKHNFVYAAPMNEGVMMVLKMFKVQDKTCMRIINWLKKMGFLPGFSDLIILHDGKAYCMELKTETGKMSERQKLFRKNVLKTGVDYAVVRSLDQAVECLRVWEVIA